jgi:preprotein translocase subunit SecE
VGLKHTLFGYTVVVVVVVSVTLELFYLAAFRIGWQS